MLRKTALAIIGTALFTGLVFGQNQWGTWTLTAGTTKLTLVLNQGTSGQVTGTLTSTTGTRFDLNGNVQESVITGTCKGQAGNSQFKSFLQGSDLIFTLIETDANGQGTARSLRFVRATSGSSTLDALGLPPSQTEAAAPTTPQTPSAAGSATRHPEMGIAFTTPAGWIVQKKDDAILLGSTTHKGFILIRRHEYKNIEQMASEARQGIIDETAGMRLMPSSQFQAFGKNGLAVEFSGTIQGREAKTYAIGLIASEGGGVTIMAAVETASYTEAYPGFVRAIAGGLTFISAEPSAGTQAGDSSDADLKAYFTGEWYSYTSGSTIYGSAGTERKMTLCANGLYRDSSEFSASGRDWGTASEQAGWGRWVIRGNRTQGVIVVRYSNGKTRQITYQKNPKSGKIYNFDGIMFVYAGEPKCP
jgi:hypothetical protein